nr:hypothetical protein [Mycobacterium uberis]
MKLLIRAHQHDAARPDTALTVPASVSVITTDVVIVGSGADCAIVAHALARDDVRTVVLERGRRWTVNEFRTSHPIDRYAGLYSSAGTTIGWYDQSLALTIGGGRQHYCR